MGWYIIAMMMIVVIIVIVAITGIVHLVGWML